MVFFEESYGRLVKVTHFILMFRPDYEHRGTYLTSRCDDLRRQVDQLVGLEEGGYISEAESNADLVASRQGYEREFGSIKTIGGLLPEPSHAVNDLPLLEQFVRFVGLANITSHDVRPTSRKGGENQSVKAGRLSRAVVRDDEGRLEQEVSRGAEITVNTAYNQAGVSVQATGATLKGPAHYQGEYSQRVTTGSVHARAGLLGKFKDYVRGLEGAHNAEVDIFGISTEVARGGRAVLPSFDGGTTEIVEASYDRDTEFSAFVNSGLLGNADVVLPDGRSVQVSHGGSFERIEFNGEVREVHTFGLLGKAAQRLSNRG